MSDEDVYDEYDIERDIKVWFPPKSERVFNVILGNDLTAIQTYQCPVCTHEMEPHTIMDRIDIDEYISHLFMICDCCGHMIEFRDRLQHLRYCGGGNITW